MSEQGVERTVGILMGKGQAARVSAALDLFSRLGIGQFEELAEAARWGYLYDIVPCPSDRPVLRNEWQGAETGGEVAQAQAHEEDGATRVRSLCVVNSQAQWLKMLLNYPANGSYGIGHAHVADKFKRAWEMKKVIDRALAYESDPNPKYRGVNYDGLSYRLCRDEAPAAEFRDGKDGTRVCEVRFGPGYSQALDEALGLALALGRGNMEPFSRMLESGDIPVFWDKMSDRRVTLAELPDGRERETKIADIADLVRSIGLRIGGQTPEVTENLGAVREHLASAATEKRATCADSPEP